MNKILTVLLVLTVAFSAFATVASAKEVVGTTDLLASTGYGDPEYLHDEDIGLNCSEWDSHCDWQLHCGYLGFLSNGYPEEVTATRSIVSTTLSDSSTGYALKVKNDTGRACFIETALENMDLLCGGLEEGQKYRVQVVAKVMEGQFDTIPSISVNTGTPVQMTVDSAWHTYTVDFVYTSVGAAAAELRTHSNWDGCCNGIYKDTYAITLHLTNIGLSYADTEIYYESIKVFEVNDNGQTGDAMMLFVTMFTVAIAASVVMLKKKAY